MTDATVVPAPTPRRHRWPKDGEGGFRHVLPHESADGCEHFERTCVLCGMTQITIVPPRPEPAWHEWKTKAGAKWIGEATPPCLAPLEQVTA